MVEKLLDIVLQYSGYGLELSLLVLLLWRRPRTRLAALCGYVFLLFAVDGVGRPYILYHYGLESSQYRYFYYVTDASITLGAFLLVCSFLRRACTEEKRLWGFTRLFLAFVFILVPGITLVTLSRNSGQIGVRGTPFVYEFSQNLYFTCLILNTLLYLMMQKIECADDELGLLVCGMGIQFAGPAASSALVVLTGQEQFATSLNTLIIPLCNLGMLCTWLYAVSRAGKTVPAFSAGRFGKGEMVASASLSGAR
jgi:hypothetical protein